MIKMSNLPNQPILKQFQITSCDSKQGTLSKMNPFFWIAREINEICGEVENIDYRRSGSILITTKTADSSLNENSYQQAIVEETLTSGKYILVFQISILKIYIKFK